MYVDQGAAQKHQTDDEIEKSSAVGKSKMKRKKYNNEEESSLSSFVPAHAPLLFEAAGKFFLAHLIIVHVFNTLSTPFRS